jgi:hypothetical protein
MEGPTAEILGKRFGLRLKSILLGLFREMVTVCYSSSQNQGFKSGIRSGASRSGIQL